MRRHRRAAPEVPVLRQPQLHAASCVAEGREINRKRVQRLMRLMGHRGDRAEAEHEPSRARASGLSVPAARPHDRPAEPSLGGGHHVHPAGARLRVSGGDHGLVLASRSLAGGCRTRSTAASASRPWRRPCGASVAPEIFNTDQGAQFTAEAFTAPLLARGVKISMDGKGRCIDNVFVERLWRSLKYEEVYLHDYDDLWKPAPGSAPTSSSTQPPSVGLLDAGRVLPCARPSSVVHPSSTETHQQSTSYQSPLEPLIVYS